MESQLLQYLPKLPAADVLIHCGDFYGQRSKLPALDQFLASQTHIPTKIILRGNHDPNKSNQHLFPKSKAIFVTKSSTLNLLNNNGELIVALEPHSRNYNHHAELPRNCDILISHEPPFGILDYTYSGQRAGSTTLRRRVERSPYKPALWLCGHIHEGRGVTSHNFVPQQHEEESYSSSSSSSSSIVSKSKRHKAKLLLSQRQRRAMLTTKNHDISNNNDNDNATMGVQQSTLVVNAASANEGKARSLVNGPVLIDLILDPINENENEADTNNGTTTHDETEEVLRNTTTTTTTTTSSSTTTIGGITSEVIISPQSLSLVRPYSLEAMKCQQSSSSSSSSNDNDDDDQTHRLLLSVDVGLRTGIALFNGTGSLIKVDSFQFTSLEELSEWIVAAQQQQKQQQQQQQEDCCCSCFCFANVTHVVLEGRDPSMMSLWREAFTTQQQNNSSSVVIRVALLSAEDWRPHVLTRKEQRDARRAKTAASLIAQQIMYDSDIIDSYTTTTTTTTTTTHDAAEAIVIGHYAVRFLQWTTTTKSRPLVQRYTNGDVVVPKRLGKNTRKKKKKKK